MALACVPPWRGLLVWRRDALPAEPQPGWPPAMLMEPSLGMDAAAQPALRPSPSAAAQAVVRDQERLLTAVLSAMRASHKVRVAGLLRAPAAMPVLATPAVGCAMCAQAAVFTACRALGQFGTPAGRQAGLRREAEQRGSLVAACGAASCLAVEPARPRISFLLRCKGDELDIKPVG